MYFLEDTPLGTNPPLLTGHIPSLYRTYLMVRQTKNAPKVSVGVDIMHEINGIWASVSVGQVIHHVQR